jgi:hypothetical protein
MRTLIGFVFLGSLLAANEPITLHHGADCAPTMRALEQVRAARLKYYGTDDPAFQPPDTVAGYHASVVVGDLQVHLNVLTLGPTTATLLERTNQPTILKVKPQKENRVCFIWAADAKR